MTYRTRKANQTIQDTRTRSWETLEARQLLAAAAGGLDWSTFVGGAGADAIIDVVAVPDGSGDVVVIGTTSSDDFPATGGTRTPPTPEGFATDTPFVARISGDGKRLVYATYFGNRGTPARVAVAADGSPVIVGETSSAEFVTTSGAFTTPATDGSDLFVVKLDPTGSRVVFSSRFGGTDSETVGGIGVDAAGGIVVAGYTPSADLPTTAGAFDRTINQRLIDGEPDASTDAFVARLSADGKQLTYSTFIGGEGDDRANAITVDPQGFVTLVGETNAFDEQDGVFTGAAFPTTADAFQRKFQGQEDGFVARLKLDGKGAADLRYASILGSVGEDMAWSVAHDPQDPLKVVVTSQTDGWNWPTTPGALQRTRLHPGLEGDPDLGVTAFRFGPATGGRLEWSTLHGQISAYLSDTDVAIDGAGNVVLAGVTERYDFGGQNDRPTTQGAFDQTPESNGAFVSRLSGDGRRLLYETNLDFAGTSLPKVAAVGADSAVVVGTTQVPEFPTTAGSLDPVMNDGTPQGNIPNDGYAARFTFAPINPADVTGPAAPTPVAPAEGAKVTAFKPDGSGNQVTFDWTDVTDPSGVRLYELEVGHNPEFVQQSETDDGARTLVRSAQSKAEVNMPDLRDGQVYHWRVRALDGANNFGPWSTARRIVVGDVAGPRLAASVVLPDAVPAGTPAQGKVLLQGIAPAGGITIALSSSNPAVASVPATVKVLAGASSATFPITTKTVIASTAVQIRSELGDESSAAVLWVDPKLVTPPPPTAASLASLSLKPNTSVGGKPVQGVVTLTAPAPAGGVVVRLNSEKGGLARVPDTVTILAGQRTATFTITTSTTRKTEWLKVTAELGQVSQRAILTVTPAAKDVLKVTKAEYRSDKRELRIKATGTNAAATIHAYDGGTNKRIGTLTRKGDGRFEGRFTWPTKPKNLILRSDNGGSAVWTF